MAKSIYPKTIDEATERLLSEISLDLVLLLAATADDELSYLHLSLGTYIRNEFGLWAGNEALLNSCQSVADKESIDADEAATIILKALRNLILERDEIVKYLHDKDV